MYIYLNYIRRNPGGRRALLVIQIILSMKSEGAVTTNEKKKIFCTEIRIYQFISSLRLEGGHPIDPLFN